MTDKTCGEFNRTKPTASVRVEENALIITLPHTCTLEALEDLQTGIIEAIKYQYANYDHALGWEQQLIDSNYMLLELLKATLNKKEQMKNDEH